MTASTAHTGRASPVRVLQFYFPFYIHTPAFSGAQQIHTVSLLNRHRKVARMFCSCANTVTQTGGPNVAALTSAGRPENPPLLLLRVVLGRARTGTQTTPRHRLTLRQLQDSTLTLSSLRVGARRTTGRSSYSSGRAARQPRSWSADGAPQRAHRHSRGRPSGTPLPSARPGPRPPRSRRPSKPPTATPLAAKQAEAKQEADKKAAADRETRLEREQQERDASAERQRAATQADVARSAQWAADAPRRAADEKDRRDRESAQLEALWWRNSHGWRRFVPFLER